MKRHGNLWQQVVSFEALLRAADTARKGKRFRPSVAEFHFDQERALWKLHEELSTKTYRPGAYRSFFIYEPKKRQISAAPYRDRVVHHALVGQIIDHSNLQEQILTYFPGDDLFTPSERRRGIPIGNQTSQFFANVYLDPLDHFVKDRLRIKGYVRYVDDFLVFSDDKSQLADVREKIREFLVRLRLRLHPKKSVVFPVKDGIRFLGYRVFPTHRLLPKENVRRFRRRVRGMQEDYAAGRAAFTEIY